MKKSTLILISNIVNQLDDAGEKLFEMLDLLNLTPEEKLKIEDMILVTKEKIEIIKKSQISNLDQHIDVNYIETMERY